jgi:hypothetical protein
MIAWRMSCTCSINTYEWNPGHPPPLPTVFISKQIGKTLDIRGYRHDTALSNTVTFWNSAFDHANVFFYIFYKTQLFPCQECLEDIPVAFWGLGGGGIQNLELVKIQCHIKRTRANRERQPKVQVLLWQKTSRSRTIAANEITSHFCSPCKLAWTNVAQIRTKSTVWPSETRGQPLGKE